MAEKHGKIYVGQVGWAIAKVASAAFPVHGSHLERYAQSLTAVEINSSFYKPHRPQTYERWAASVPSNFKFAVKMPRSITHTARLVDVGPQLARFLGEAMGLGPCLGPLLVQLPPSLALKVEEATSFFAELRARFTGIVVCEPRHPSWFSPAGDAVLSEFGVSLVGADPPPCPRADVPRGGLYYRRLHGSPVMYHSAYSEMSLRQVCLDLRQAAASGLDAWCIFDNTASGAALPNALFLQSLLANKSGSVSRSEQDFMTSDSV